MNDIANVQHRKVQILESLADAAFRRAERLRQQAADAEREAFKVWHLAAVQRVILSTAAPRERAA